GVTDALGVHERPRVARRLARGQGEDRRAHESLELFCGAASHTAERSISRTGHGPCVAALAKMRTVPLWISALLLAGACQAKTGEPPKLTSATAPSPALATRLRGRRDPSSASRALATARS